MQNRPTLTPFARQLRTKQTDCEHLLWQKLRARQIANLKFRRQYPCPPYVLDFYCAELKLAIELDGGQHHESPGVIHDLRRTRCLNQKGIEVLRFSNLEVMQQMDDVLEQIIRIAANRKAPSLTLSLRESEPIGGYSRNSST